jgi:hypothetical protein
MELKTNIFQSQKSQFKPFHVGVADMRTLSANNVLNGTKFKFHEKIEVTPTKHFTVVDAAIAINPVSGDVNVTLTIDYVNGNHSGIDVINASQLKEFLK